MLSALDVMMFYPNRAASGGGGGGAWTPASLTGINTWGEADPSTLYINTGTTLVSADGDAIAQWNDKSGNAHNLGDFYAVGSTSRPLYKVGTGGKHYVQFDGTNDYLATAAISQTDGTGQFYLAVSCSFDSVATAMAISGIGDSASVANLRHAGGPLAATSYNTVPAGTADNNGTIAANTNVVLIMTVTPTAVELWVDNVSDGSTALTGTRQTSSQPMFIGAGVTATEYALAKVYGFVQGKGTLSSTDRASLQTYLAALHP